MAHATENSKLGYITIATVHRRQEARLIAAKLAAAAVECLLVDERDTAQLTFGKRGGGEIKIQVKRQDVARALPLLHVDNEAAGKISPVEDTPRRLPRATSSFTGWKRTALEFAAVIAFAGLLALLLFY